MTANKIKGLNPFDLRCSICRSRISNDKLYAAIDLPNGKPGFVCISHHGIVRLVKHTSQVFRGHMINGVVWAFREQLSVEEAIKVYEGQLS